MSHTVITNVLLPIEEHMQPGTLVLDGPTIVSLERGTSHLSSAQNWQGDYLLPGLVEMHTDHLETQLVPRPKVIWPDGLAACVAHDAMMAAAGVTTVFDAITMGSYDGEKSPRKAILGTLIEAVLTGRKTKALRIDHKLHFRCELSSPDLMSYLERFQHTEALGLVSIMDHTPGQRQWRDLEKLIQFVERTGQTRLEIEATIKAQMQRGQEACQAQRPLVRELFAGRGIVFASHDDTTVQHVEQAAADGVRISEFPCTLEAARAAKRHGIATIGGGPNIVRGGSHSGNVSMFELEAENLLDGISSDYVPSSLLQAVWRLAHDEGCSIAKHLPKVTRNVAAMVGLSDRGWLAPGLRADFIRVRDIQGTPVVKETYVLGQRVL